MNRDLTFTEDNFENLTWTNKEEVMSEYSNLKGYKEKNSIPDVAICITNFKGFFGNEKNYFWQHYRKN